MQLSKELGRLVKALQDRPVLHQHLIPFWEAFDLLSSSRTFTMGGSGPIPLSEIVTYINWAGIQGKDQQRRFIRYMREMDTEYLSLVNDNGRDGS